MSGRRPHVIVLIGCCVLLGGSTIETAVPAVASSAGSSPTVVHQLTTRFPLGPQRLCCQSQSRSHSQTAAAPPASVATPAGSPSASGSSGAGSSAGPGHASSGGMGAVLWIALGAAVATLLAAGVSGLRRARRGPAPVLPPGLPAVGYVTAVAGPATATAAASAPGEPDFRRLDRSGDAGGAFNLGVVLHRRGDVAGAMAAYERAHERCDPDAAFNLGVLLYETGDLDGAGAAWQRSVERGHARAAANLVFLAHRRRSAVHGELAVPAEERRSAERLEMVDKLIYGRADERGGARGAFNLGVLLHQRGDVTGAIAAYRRAEQRGDADAAFNLGVLLYEIGDLDGAEASWRRSVDRGNPQATENLAFLVRRRRERTTAGSGVTGGDR